MSEIFSNERKYVSARKFEKEKLTVEGPALVWVAKGDFGESGIFFDHVYFIIFLLELKFLSTIFLQIYSFHFECFGWTET